MDISVKWGISLSELGLVTVKTRDTKENGREPVLPLLWKQVPRAFWGKCASCLGNRPSYSLPLAWHEINCSSALRVSEGENNSHHPVSSCLGAPLFPPDGLWYSTFGNWRPQARAVCTRLLSVPAAPEPSPAAGEIRALEVVRLGTMLESSHQTLFQQCSAPKSLSHLLRTPGTTGPGPRGLTGQQTSEGHQLRKEHTARLSSAGGHRAISGEEWHRPHSLSPPRTARCPHYIPPP